MSPVPKKATGGFGFVFIPRLCQSLEVKLARIMNKFSTAATKSSALAAFHSVGLLNVLKSTFAGASVVSLVRSAPSSLRDENLCIIRAKKEDRLMKRAMLWMLTWIVVWAVGAGAGWAQSSSSSGTLKIGFIDVRFTRNFGHPHPERFTSAYDP